MRRYTHFTQEASHAQFFSPLIDFRQSPVIYYNARLLSQVRQAKETGGDAQGAARLTQVSPVAWQHLNFYGRYEFRKGPQAINMEEIVQELAHVPVRPILEG